MSTEISREQRPEFAEPAHAAASERVTRRLRNLGIALPLVPGEAAVGLRSFGFEEPYKVVSCYSTEYPVRDDVPTDNELPGIVLNALYADGMEVFTRPEGSWLDVSNQLLSRADQEEKTAYKNSYIAAAVLSAYYAPAEETAAFVEQVYKTGMQADVAAACEVSNIVGIKEGQRGQVVTTFTLRVMAPIFTLDPAHAQVYLDHQKGITPDQADLPSAKRAQNMMHEAIEKTGVVDPALQLLGVQASVAGENVGGPILDPRKAERYAFHKYFLERQMKRILGEDVTATPFAAILRQKREEPVSLTDAYGSKLSNPELSKFKSDLRATFQQLTEPLVAQFSLPKPGEKPTHEQAIAQRFRKLTQELHAYELLGKFIDTGAYDMQESLSGIEISAHKTQELSTIAATGAALPELLFKWLLSAQNAVQSSFDHARITPELLQNNMVPRRGLLIRAAMTGIAEFSSQRFEMPSQSAIINDAGDLELKTGFKLPAKGALGQATAVIVDCPAAHTIHPSRKNLTSAEKQQYGSKNFIDHLLAIALNEAVARGIFANLCESAGGTVE